MKRFDEERILDIAHINGYVTALALAMNTPRILIPADGKRLPRWAQSLAALSREPRRPFAQRKIQFFYE